MSFLTRPSLPLPPPLRGSDRDSFAEDTVVRRMPATVKALMDENHFSAEINTRLQTLIDDLPDGKLRPLTDTAAPDFDHWNKALAPYASESWLTAPWLVSEITVYRRIAEATGFFDGPLANYDPFQQQKRAGLSHDLANMTQLCDRLETLLSQSVSEGALEELIVTALWGNQADLSLWKAGSDGPGGGQSADKILVNHAQLAAQHILNSQNGANRLDYILDNGAFELHCDLILSDYLLTQGLMQEVKLHCKLYPFYVSDVMIPDVQIILDHYASAGHDATIAFGERLAAHIAAGRISLQTDPHWTLPKTHFEIPEALYHHLAGATLLISKGDLNYRRWLGDRQWAYDTPLDQVVSYAAAPLMLLRTLKSDVAVGLAPSTTTHLNKTDPTWDVSGKYGVIQFVSGD